MVLSDKEQTLHREVIGFECSRTEAKISSVFLPREYAGLHALFQEERLVIAGSITGAPSQSDKQRISACNRVPGVANPRGFICWKWDVNVWVPGVPARFDAVERDSGREDFGKSSSTWASQAHPSVVQRQDDPFEISCDSPEELFVYLLFAKPVVRVPHVSSRFRHRILLKAGCQLMRRRFVLDSRPGILRFNQIPSQTATISLHPPLRSTCLPAIDGWNSRRGQAPCSGAMLTAGAESEKSI